MCLEWETLISKEPQIWLFLFLEKLSPFIIENIPLSVPQSSGIHGMPLPLDPAVEKIRSIFLKSKYSLQANCGHLRKMSKLHFFHKKGERKNRGSYPKTSMRHKCDICKDIESGQ